jgi:anti-anti-sigma factor
VEPAAHQPNPTDARFFVRGEIDSANAAGLQVDLDDEIGVSIDDLVVDCSELAFIDSSGLIVLLLTQQTLRELGRDLRIVNADRATRRVLALMGLVADPNADDDR